MANIADRLMEFQHSLDPYPADAPVPWTIAQLFNALLIEVEKGWLTDPLVQAVLRAEIHDVPDVAGVSCGEMRAAVSQLLMVVESSPPRNHALEGLEDDRKAMDTSQEGDAGPDEQEPREQNPPS